MASLLVYKAGRLMLLLLLLPSFCRYHCRVTASRQSWPPHTAASEQPAGYRHTCSAGGAQQLPCHPSGRAQFEDAAPLGLVAAGGAVSAVGE
jgi:hypothetical protein